ncbi:hypothetical protein D3C81_2090660 [compost metagenome]
MPSSAWPTMNTATMPSIGYRSPPNWNSPAISAAPIPMINPMYGTIAASPAIRPISKPNSSPTSIRPAA